MYATAQRVRTPGGQVGINVLVYHHGDRPVPRRDSHFDVGRVMQEDPGELVMQQLQVARGGNEVLSYVDVVGDDGASMLQVQRALDGIAHTLPSDLPEVCPGAQVSAVFGAVLGLPRSFMSEEFQELRQGLEWVLFHTPEPRRWLDILVRTTPDSLVFALTAASVARISEIRADIRVTPSIAVPLVVADDFRKLHGNLRPHLASLLTRLDERDVIALGGVRFVSEDGELLARWPDAEVRPQLGDGPIYAVSSGRFLGWRSAGNFFDRNGIHRGYFDADVLLTLDGLYMAEPYPTHSSYYGVPKGRDPIQLGMQRAQESLRQLPSRSDRSSIADPAWSDPSLP